MESALGLGDDFWEKLSGGNVVPWSSWHEWNFVADSLFSSSPAPALRRIRAWRGKGSLPAIVDITASLIEIQHRDPFFTAGQASDGFLSQEMMSMLYCMAIIRLVNCVIEKTRKRNGKSIAEAAEEIQIPRMLIDIRHEGSHRDLPSLEILRLASVEALQWSKTYYWEPQKDAVRCQEDEIVHVQKEIEAKINELAFMLTMKETPKKSSSIVDRKSPKKRIRKALKNLRRLYLSFPFEVVDVLLNYMIKPFYSSSMSEIPVEVQATPCGRNIQSVFDAWGPAITKLSKKDQNFIFTLLEVVLSKIQMQYSEGSNIEDTSSLDTVEDSLQVYGLSALFAWLVGNLQNIKSSKDKSSAVDCKDTSNILKQPYRIMKLLRTCLHVAAPGNAQLSESALVLAQKTGNGLLPEKLKKLLKHSSLGDIDNMAEHTLEQMENDVRRAANEFELVKVNKLKMETSHTTRNDDLGTDSKWGVAESWSQCVIGMLPQGFGSLDIPLDRELTGDGHEVYKSLLAKESAEIISCSCKRKHSDGDILLFGDPEVKRLKETVENPEPEGQADRLDEDIHDGGVNGHLMVDGVWRRIGEEEICAIQSAIRIMV
uniref:Las1-like protein n=2 Tax=Kalanchoe fedtschenkoi TaxID=63787 RepID=A0A7N0ZUD7_KALFE